MNNLDVASFYPLIVLWTALERSPESRHEYQLIAISLMKRETNHQGRKCDPQFRAKLISTSMKIKLLQTSWNFIWAKNGRHASTFILITYYPLILRRTNKIPTVISL